TDTYNDSYDNQDTYSDNPDESASEEIVPGWMTQAPQPFIEGPVITFSKVTFNFVTRYDSVFLKSTKGNFSLKDGVFVGEGGTFDWSPAGLNPDSVYCTFTEYNFNAAHPELKSDLVKLNY